MDATSIWLHNINIDRTLDRLGTHIDPRKRAALLKFLIEEEDQLGAGLERWNVRRAACAKAKRVSAGRWLLLKA